MLIERPQAFFDFIKEREQVRLRKEAGLSRPWTEDTILQQFKFTNVFRHHDRTSRVLRETYYGPHFHEDKATILMNCATFRYFGTWEFADALGWVQIGDMDDWWWEEVKQLAKDRLECKERVFTGAYVITNQGISEPKQEVVVDYFLKGLQENIQEIVDTATATESWQDVADEMRKLKGFGGSGFMTKEILLDTTYTSFWDDVVEDPADGTFSFPLDWMTWTPIGPGARRGAARVQGDNTAYALTEKEAGEVIKGLLHGAPHYWPTEWKDLSPHDIQFQLCEFDKYERVRLKQGRPRSKYNGTGS